MKKIILPILCLAACLLPAGAQVIKLDAGASLAAMTSNEYGFFTDYSAGFSGLIGIDYLEHDWFYLSSQVGYMATGGNCKIDLEAGSETSANMRLRRDNIHVNTTFRLKWQMCHTFHIYVGAGPKVDFPVSNTISLLDMKEVNSELIDKSVMFGLKTEIGAAYDISRMRLGVNFAYLPDLTKQSIPIQTTAHNTIFTIGISVGFFL